MTTRQVKEHAAALALAIDGGDTVSKGRKQRSDKGTKWKHLVAVNEKEDEESEDDNEVALPAKKKKSGTIKKASTAKKSKANKAAKTAQCIARTLPPTAPKSKEFIGSEDDKSDS